MPVESGANLRSAMRTRNSIMMVFDAVTLAGLVSAAILAGIILVVCISQGCRI